MKVRVMGKPEEIERLKGVLRAVGVTIDYESGEYYVRGSSEAVRVYFDATLPLQLKVSIGFGVSEDDSNNNL